MTERQGKASWQRNYWLARWQNPRYGLRSLTLRRDQYTCQACARTEHSSRLHAHHIVPHKGDMSLFWNPANLMTLCEDCHREHTTQTERRGYSNQIGDDGLPLDPAHPFNRRP